MTSSPQNGSANLSISSRMSELLAGMAKALVDKPDAVRVEMDETGESTTLRLYVAADDLGKVIGKQGRTARSLRTILSAIGSRAQHRFSLDVLESEGGAFHPQS